MNMGRYQYLTFENAYSHYYSKISERLSMLNNNLYWYYTVDTTCNYCLTYVYRPDTNLLRWSDLTLAVEYILQRTSLTSEEIGRAHV